MAYSLFRITSFERGMIPSFPMTVLPQGAEEGAQGYTKKLKDLDFDNVPGVLFKRNGTEKVLGDLENIPSKLYEFKRTDTQEIFFLALHGNKLSYWDKDAESWADIRDDLTPTDFASMKTFANQVAVVNGVEDSFLWSSEQKVFGESVGEGDGQTTEFSLSHPPIEPDSEEIFLDGEETQDYTINNSTGDITFDTAPGDGEEIKANYEVANGVVSPEQFPKAKYLAEFRLRLVAAGDPDDPLMLRLSHPGDPRLWDATLVESSSIAAYVSPDDGQKITGVMALDDFLLIGKERNLYGLFGTTTNDFAIFPIDATVGVGSHWSMKSVRESAYFVSSKGKIYKLVPGERAKDISAPIKNLLKEVDLGNIEDTVAEVIDSDQYLVSFPTKDGSRLVLVLDTTEERWRDWSLKVKKTAPTEEDSNGELYYVEPDGVSIYRLTWDKLTEHDGSPVQSYMETPEFHFGHPGVMKEIRNVYLRFRKTEETTNLTFSFCLDNDWTRGIEVQVPEGGGYHTAKIPIKKTCREFQFSLSSVEPRQFELLDGDITYSFKEVE